ncbi:MAG: branched-chain amino acid ABC transporter permease [Alphaproteobacteria bacterium]|nr:branched-chain amino acid ABC transporter permease [Alphaproteobacteria bacterium]MBU1561649.1 branched-chain amino acid ABC transporter permease [Alphaproteobacteria bacterium]MBU2302370.1 branched-chain amino acid ABC transporter permease [Alphaproteobacteria bacterium]MBU2368650.1 branched-chain amino acid ABC transporter permease [Alphaproteobacteria bacterium]
MTDTNASFPARVTAGFDRFGGVLWLPVLLAIVALLLIGQPSTWATLTIAGLAMGMMIFLMASGLSLIFGLMDVLNFGHSAFVTAGAFIGATVLAWLGFWVTGSNPALNVMGLLIAITVATVFGALAGWFFERVVIRPVYQDHLRQILITVGALIVAEELVLLVWGGAPIPVPRPAALTGSFVLGGVSVEIYRIFAFLLGLAVYIAMYLVLNRTRLGLLIRAGVENREMVEALGFRIDRLFILVFMAGSALAAMGGAMWAGYQGLITAAIGSEMMILVFIVVIIGGLGSIQGSLLGAILVGLMANYVAFLMPKMALASNMLLMMTILLWRPYGLLPAVKR